MRNRLPLLKNKAPLPLLPAASINALPAWSARIARFIRIRARTAGGIPASHTAHGRTTYRFCLRQMPHRGTASLTLRSLNQRTARLERSHCSFRLTRSGRFCLRHMPHRGTASLTLRSLNQRTARLERSHCSFRLTRSGRFCLRQMPHRGTASLTPRAAPWSVSLTVPSPVH